MKDTQRINALRAIREATGLPQRDFASKMEISQSSVQLSEIGRRKILRPLALRVSAYTGCNPEALMRNEALDLGGNPYTKESFSFWVNTPYSAENVEAIAHRLGQASEFVCKAAASGAGGPESEPHRFREVATQLTQAIEDVLMNFKLLDGLNAKLAEGVSAGDWKSMKLEDVRKEYRGAKAWEDIDNQSLDKNTPIKVRTTVNPVWGAFFGQCFNIEPGNFAKGNLKVRRKVEIKVPWRKDIVVLWCTELHEPASGDRIQAIIKSIPE